MNSQETSVQTYCGQTELKTLKQDGDTGPKALNSLAETS